MLDQTLHSACVVAFPRATRAKILVVQWYPSVLWGLRVWKKEEDISRCWQIEWRDMSFSSMVSCNQEVARFPVNTASFAINLLVYT